MCHGSVTCWLVCHGVRVPVGLCVMVACVSWCALVGLCHGCVLGLCIKVACVMGVYLGCASRWLVSWVCTWVVHQGGLCHGCVLELCIKVACVMGVYLGCASRWLVSWVCT